MATKVIYLDIDGVLNCATTTQSVGGIVGVEKTKLQLLKKIVELTGAKIVLISTWKEGWVKNEKFKPFQSIFARYLDEEFAKVGLTVFDKTTGGVYARSEGIVEFNERFSVKKFAILDDTYADYDGFDLTDNLVKTDAKIGLDDEVVDRVINLLK